MSIKKLINRAGFLEYAGITMLLIIAALIYIFISPKSADVLVTVRIAEKDLIWQDNGSPKGTSAEAIRVGVQGKDGLGRVIAEVTDVTSFEQPRTGTPFTTKKTMYVTLRLRASYNDKSDQYRYQGTTLQVGEWVRLSIQSVIINGIIVRVPAGEKEKPVWVTVKAQVKSDGPLLHEPFTETTGVDKTIADAIVVGDTVKDSNGEILAEVLEKTVTPALRTSWDMYGNVFNKPHPRKYDVFLTIRLATRKVGDGLYYLDSSPIKINAPVPLFLSRIDIEPRITEIITSSQ